MKSEFRDIIPNDKKTIRNIPIPEGRRSSNIHTSEIKKPTISKRNIAKEIKEDVEDDEREHFDVSFLEKNNKKNKSSLSVWFFAIASVVLVMYLVTKVLSSTTVEIAMKKIDIKADSVLSAEIKGSGNGELYFSSMEISNEMSKTIPGTGEKEVSTKSTGTIVIYNNTSASQVLVSGTRFETANNLIFKIEKTITVPAKNTIAGKSTPGSIEAKVIAEKPGVLYNIEPSDFTIPGFAGGPKFNTIYARSKKSMTGGNIGKIATVDNKDLLQIREELQKSLLIETISKARAEVPKDFILIEGSFNTSFSEDDPVLDNKSAKINEKLQLKAYLFDKKEFMIILAEKNKTEILKDEQVDLNFDKLTISNISELGNKITFNVKGELSGNYVVNEDNLKKDLLNKEKKHVQGVLSKYLSIERVKVIIKPFWVSKVPDSPDSIKVIKID